METLKLTLDGIAYLKDAHAIDLIDGTELNLKEAESMAALFVAGSRHWKHAPTIEQVRGEFDAFEIFAAVGAMLERFNAGKPKRATKKTARRR